MLWLCSGDFAPTSCWEGADIFKKCSWRCLVARINVFGDSIHIGNSFDPRQGKELFDLRCEGEGTILGPNIQWFHPKSITRKDNDPPSQVNDDQSPHTIEASKTPRAPLAVGRKNDFGIRASRKRVAELTEFIPQFEVVVNLTIECNPNALIL